MKNKYYLMSLSLSLSLSFSLSLSLIIIFYYWDISLKADYSNKTDLLIIKKSINY